MPSGAAATPSKRYSGRLASNGDGGTSTWNTGEGPSSTRQVTSATTDATKVTVNTTGEKSRCTSSRTNTRPASGALNAADRPAPAPAAIKVLRSRGEQRNQPATICPIAP